MRSLLSIVLYVILLHGVSFAQVNSLPDSTFAIGTFDKAVINMSIQTDGKIVVVGSFTHYKNFSVNGIARLNTDGTLDTSFRTGSGANNYGIKSSSGAMSLAIQSDGKIIIGGYFEKYNGVSTKRIARLNPNGALDTTFKIGIGANDQINRVVLQDDGKILIGGLFTRYNGTVVQQIARLNSDGTLDDTFNNIGVGISNSSGTIASVSAIIVQPDNKILVGGSFNGYNGANTGNMIRLNPDGTLDNSFVGGSGTVEIISTIALQPDGKIILGGELTSYRGQSVNKIVRLNIDGTIDNSFSTGYLNRGISSITIQPDQKVIVTGPFSKGVARLNSDGSVDNTFVVGSGVSSDDVVFVSTLLSSGKIIIGGWFNDINGIVRNNIAMLNNSGTLDFNFFETKGTKGGTNGIVYHVNFYKDKMYISGNFTSYNNKYIKKVARLNLDGSIDSTFVPGNIPTIPSYITSSVSFTAIQPDGKIIIVGSFNSYNGVAVPGIARLNEDGTLDNGFNLGSGPSGGVSNIIFHNNGKIYMCGSFTSFNGISANKIVRLNYDGTIDNTFNFSSSIVGNIYSSIILSDGTIVIGGDFTIYTTSGQRKGIARLNTNGTIDSTFNPSSYPYGNQVYKLVLQEDGRILVGGDSKNTYLETIGIYRLFNNGRKDPTFKILPSYRSDHVYSISLQGNGKIIISGGNYSNSSNRPILRLNADGTIDNTFSVSNLYTTVNSYIQPDGKIVATASPIVYESVPEYNSKIQYNSLIRFYGDPIIYNKINGHVFTDNNSNCNSEYYETPLPDIIVKAIPGPYYGLSNQIGQYKITVDSGRVDYTISPEFSNLNSKLLINQCIDTHTVSLSGSNTDTCCFDFADSLKQCYMLNVTIQNSRFRRCFKNNTFVEYCNEGNQTATTAQVRIEYPSYVVPLSSSPMWTSKNGNVLLYNLGSISPNNCGKIVITDSVLCGDESIRGMTQCIKASITPKSNCFPENSSWDHSDINVIGFCVDDSAKFTISNNGSGNMNSSRSYRVYMNDTLIYSNSYLLKINEQFTLIYPSDGQTIRVEADQHSFYPGISYPKATIEYCGTADHIVRNLVTTTPLDDYIEEKAITCNSIIDSYDPNDKKAAPTGIGIDHQVTPGTELEYIIRFQNTGSDTAYFIKIVDTLDAFLDVASFTKGVSSHPYEINISGRGKAVVTFNFYNIRLPDSTTNKLASNGLVSYRVKVPDTAVVGTVISNKADIYFDYNSPITTNIVFHTVGLTQEEDFTKGDKIRVEEVTLGLYKKYDTNQIKLYPNPSIG